MVRFIFDYGLYNTTFWAVLACAAVVGIRGRLPSAAWRGWKPLAFLLVLGTAMNLAIGLGRAYISPRDFLQDIVSAKEYLAFRSIYPDGMASHFAELLAEEDHRNISVGYTLGQYSNRSRYDTLNQHWVQAHPPFMTAFFAALYKEFGLFGTQLGLALISMICLGWATVAIVGELKPDWGRWPTIAFVAAACGAGPVITSFRNGQCDLIMLALLSMSWILIRRCEHFSGGAVIGIAISLKLIPAILLPVLLIRWPRAFLGATLAFGATLILVICHCGFSVLPEYQRTAAGIIQEYAGYPSNISLLGFINRGLAMLDFSTALAKPLWQVTGIVVATSLIALAYSRWKIENSQTSTDLFFGLGVSLMPLCSPVAWDHYLTFLLLPLAIVSRRQPARWLILPILAWAIPETAYLQVHDICRAHRFLALDVWIVSPLRTYAMAALTGWFLVHLVEFIPEMSFLRTFTKGTVIRD